MNGVLPIRLRVPLRLKTREDRMREAWLGRELPPVVVPARTTLRVVELEMEGALMLTPDARRVYVSRETIRDHGYVPRG